MSKQGVFSGPYSVQKRENTDQTKLCIWTFFAQWELCFSLDIAMSNQKYYFYSLEIYNRAPYDVILRWVESPKQKEVVVKSLRQEYLVSVILKSKTPNTLIIRGYRYDTMERIALNGREVLQVLPSTDHSVTYIHVEGTICSFI